MSDSSSSDDLVVEEVEMDPVSETNVFEKTGRRSVALIVWPWLPSVPFPSTTIIINSWARDRESVLAMVSSERLWEIEDGGTSGNNRVLVDDSTRLKYRVWGFCRKWDQRRECRTNWCDIPYSG